MGFFLCVQEYVLQDDSNFMLEKNYGGLSFWYSTTAQAKNRFTAKAIITSFCNSSFLWSLLSESWFQAAGEICPDYSWRYYTCRHIWDRTQKSKEYRVKEQCGHVSVVWVNISVFMCLQQCNFKLWLPPLVPSAEPDFMRFFFLPFLLGSQSYSFTLKSASNV